MCCRLSPRGCIRLDITGRQHHASHGVARHVAYLPCRYFKRDLLGSSSFVNLNSNIIRSDIRKKEMVQSRHLSGQIVSPFTTISAMLTQQMDGLSLMTVPPYRGTACLSLHNFWRARADQAPKIIGKGMNSLKTSKMVETYRIMYIGHENKNTIVFRSHSGRREGIVNTDLRP